MSTNINELIYEASMRAFEKGVQHERERILHLIFTNKKGSELLALIKKEKQSS